MNIERRQTILYGGAFNPPTNAHMAIVQELIDTARYDDADVWVMPSGQRRDKRILAEQAIRMSYVEALLASADTHGVGTEIETYELECAEETETFATNAYLEATYPDRRFTWVFGSDSVNSMRQWHGGEWLLANLDMIVVERPGYELSERPARHHVIRLGEMAVSSSEVRRRIDQGIDIRDLVPEPVIGVLRQNGVLTAW